MGRIARALRALAAALAGTGGNGFAGSCFSLSAYSVLRQPPRILRLLPQCLERRLQPGLHRQNHCGAGTGSRNSSRKRQNPCRLFRRRYAYRFADRKFGAPDTRVLPPSADVWDGGAAAATPCTLLSMKSRATIWTGRTCRRRFDFRPEHAVKTDIFHNRPNLSQYADAV